MYVYYQVILRGQYNLPVGAKNFSHLRILQTGSGRNLFSFPGSGVVAKNEWSYTSTPPMPTWLAYVPPDRYTVRFWQQGAFPRGAYMLVFVTRSGNSMAK